MQEKVMVNHRQFAWLTCVLMGAGGLVSLPKALVSAAEQDAWLVEMGGALYGLGVCAFFGYLSRRFPQKNLYEIAQIVAGKWGGNLLNLMSLFYLWMVLVRATRGFADFLNSTLLERTPEEISIYMFSIVLIYYGVTSLEVTARVGDFIIPLFLLFMWSLPLMLSNEFSLERLEPIMSIGPVVFSKASLMPMGWFSDVIVLGAFLHMLRNSRQLHSALRHGVMLATMTLTIVLFTVIAVLGTSMGQRAMYPAYLLVEQVHITDYLDRVELLMFSVWLPAYLIKCSVVFIAFVHCLSSFTGQRKGHGLYAKQAGWFIIITTFLAFRNVTEVFNFGNYGSMICTLVLQVPCVLAILLLARRKKFDSRDPDQEYYDSLDREALPRDKGKGLRYRLIRISPHAWFKTTNWLVVLILLLLAGGQLVGMDLPLLGRTCAITYIIVLLGAVFSSYMEMLSKKERLTILRHQKESDEQPEQESA